MHTIPNWNAGLNMLQTAFYKPIFYRNLGLGLHMTADAINELVIINFNAETI